MGVRGSRRSLIRRDSHGGMMPRTKGQADGKYLARRVPMAEPDALDGHEGTSPIKVFPPNGYGLFDMAVYVWEWTVGPVGDVGHVAVHACCAPGAVASGGREGSSPLELGVVHPPHRDRG